MALIHRTKILLSILQELGGQLSDMRMQQLLFLYCKEFVKRDEYYEFIPLNGQPYSVQAEEDKGSLVHKKLLEKSNEWILKPSSKRFATELDFFEKIAIQDLKNKCLPQSDAQLAQHIAANYPYFTGQGRNEATEMVFYTIGYEGISPEAYINLLIQNGVKLLVDVRKNAFSQKYGFSKLELASILPHVGIEYLHMPELGIESEKRQSLVTDNDYEELFKEYDKTTILKQQATLDKLEALLKDKDRVAITCFEADPYHCHRSRIAKALKAREQFTYKIEHLQSCKHSNHLKQNERKSS
jgi:uncharacterized protein (DUF488 family)